MPRRYVFSRLKVLKDLSAVAVVAGQTKYNLPQSVYVVN